MKAHQFGLIFTFLIAGILSAQPREYVTPLSESFQTGQLSEIVIENGLLYATSNYGLEVYDISDPDQPTLLGRASSCGVSNELAVQDGYVYLTDFVWGVHGYDARNPENIAEIWQWQADFAEGWYEDIKIHDNRLYVCAQNSGLVIFDLSDPAAPQFLTVIENTPFPAAITFGDSIAYVVDAAWEALFPMDLRDYQHPVVYRELNVGGFFLDIYFHNNLLLISRGNDGIAVYGTANPTLPSRIRVWNMDGWVNHLTARDNLMYVSMEGEGLFIYDITEPAAPNAVYHDTLSYAKCTAVYSENRFFEASPYSGLMTWDNSTPEQPELLNVTGREPSVYDLSADNNLLFLPRGHEGLLFLDVSDPGNPQTIYQMDTMSVNRVESTSDGWLYFYASIAREKAQYLLGWQVDDPQNPEPVWRHEIDSDLSVSDIRISDELMIVTYYLEYVELWDISNPEDPFLSGTITDISPLYSCIGNDFLYVLGEIEERPTVFAIDIIDAENPIILGSYNELQYGYGLAVQSNRAFVADGSDGVKILDVRNPGHIRFEGTIDAHDWAFKVEIDDSLLYVMDYDAGLWIYDITQDRGYPETGWLDTPGHAAYLDICNGTAYLGDVFDLTICRFDPATFVQEGISVSPTGFAVAAAYPNPFNGRINVPYSLSRSAEVSVTISDPMGRVVEHSQFSRNPGHHLWVWNGAEYPSGWYGVSLRMKDANDELWTSSRHQNVFLLK